MRRTEIAPTIRARLREISDAGLASLRRSSVVNLTAICLLLASSLWIQRIAAAAHEVSQIALLAESQRGLVSRVAAELDLTRQSEIHKRFAGISEEFSERARESSLDIAADEAEVRKLGDEIFGLAASFGQQQAMNVIDGPFAEVTDRVQGHISERTAQAETNVLRATAAMMILGVIALAAQFILGRRSERRLALQMDRLAGQISSGVEDSAAAAERVASGDLESAAVVRPGGTVETERLQKALSHMEARLRTILSELQSAAESLSVGAQQVSASAHTLSLGTARQAASMEQTTASVQQMASSIAQNADLSRMTESLASQSATRARDGSNGVRDTVTAMRRIIDCASVVQDLAAQTNLLSLNAAIEAARAGDYGRGFAVVAAEVRTLSRKSTNASMEIREVAASSIEIAERAVMLIMDLVPASEKTSTAAQEVANASAEQNSAARQIGRAVAEIDGVTQATAASSQQLAATAEAMTAQALRLRETASYFRLTTQPALQT